MFFDKSTKSKIQMQEKFITVGVAGIRVVCESILAFPAFPLNIGEVSHPEGGSMIIVYETQNCN